MDEKLQVYSEVTLECTGPWIQAPKALILPHNGRTFEVKVSLPTASSQPCLHASYFARCLGIHAIYCTIM